MAKSTRKTYVDAAGRTRSVTRASFGTVRKLPSGRWQASYVGPDEKRHPAPLTFTAKTDAEGWLAAERVRITKGEWSAGRGEAHEAQAARSQTFGAYAREWASSRISPRTGRPLAPRTVAEYLRKLESEDFAPLVDVPLSALTRKKISAWYHPIAASGRLTSASRAFQFVHGVLSSAVKDGAFDQNPADIPGASTASTGKKVQMPTDAELMIIEATMPENWRAGATLAAWGGLRYGELTELRRKDIAIEGDRAVIQVSRAVTYVDGKFIVGPTKSKAGVRPVLLFGQDARVLAEHLEKHTAASADALLFPNPNRPTEHLLQSMHYRMWDRVRKAAGRPDMPWHALRHHFGTAVAANGGTLADVQAALGDSTAQAALKYVDAAADRLADIAERMGNR